MELPPGAAERRLPAHIQFAKFGIVNMIFRQDRSKRQANAYSSPYVKMRSEARTELEAMLRIPLVSKRDGCRRASCAKETF